MVYPSSESNGGRVGEPGPGVPRAARTAEPEPDLAVDGAVAVEAVDALAARHSNAAWTARLVYFCFAVIEILLGLRILLKLIAANPESGFTRFIYGVTRPVVAPFSNIVAMPTAANGATLDLSSLLAILVYLLLSWLCVRLFLLLIERPT